jgi:hypothetical protein
MITMTYELAMAAAKDAADRRMRKANRTKWNRADYNEMVRTFNGLYSVEAGLREDALRAQYPGRSIALLSPVGQTLLARHEARLRATSAA